jgi:hypothetical protein
MGTTRDISETLSEGGINHKKRSRDTKCDDEKSIDEYKKVKCSASSTEQIESNHQTHKLEAKSEHKEILTSDELQTNHLHDEISSLFKREEAELSALPIYEKSEIETIKLHVLSILAGFSEQLPDHMLKPYVDGCYQFVIELYKKGVSSKAYVYGIEERRRRLHVLLKELTMLDTTVLLSLPISPSHSKNIYHDIVNMMSSYQVVSEVGTSSSGSSRVTLRAPSAERVAKLINPNFGIPCGDRHSLQGILFCRAWKIFYDEGCRFEKKSSYAEIDRDEFHMLWRCDNYFYVMEKNYYLFHLERKDFRDFFALRCEEFVKIYAKNGDGDYENDYPARKQKMLDFEKVCANFLDEIQVDKKNQMQRPVSISFTSSSARQEVQAFASVAGKRVQLSTEHLLTSSSSSSSAPGLFGAPIRRSQALVIRNASHVEDNPIGLLSELEPITDLTVEEVMGLMSEHDNQLANLKC